MSTPPTIKGVTAAAGVAISTLSSTLNGKASQRRINHDTQQRVLDCRPSKPSSAKRDKDFQRTWRAEPACPEPVEGAMPMHPGGDYQVMRARKLAPPIILLFADFASSRETILYFALKPEIPL